MSKSPKKDVKSQNITEHGGLVQGVYLTREASSLMASMVRKIIDHMKENQFAGRLNEASVKLYLETLEDKVAQSESVANFLIKK